MYETMDAIVKEGIFWPCMRMLWPIPFVLDDDDFGSIIDSDSGLAMFVARVHDGEVRILVQIQKTVDLDNEKELNVVLDGEGRFISGQYHGMGADEMGCTDALQMFAPIIKGTW